MRANHLREFLSRFQIQVGIRTASTTRSAFSLPAEESSVFRRGKFSVCNIVILRNRSRTEVGCFRAGGTSSAALLYGIVVFGHSNPIHVHVGFFKIGNPYPALIGRKPISYPQRRFIIRNKLPCFSHFLSVAVPDHPSISVRSIRPPLKGVCMPLTVVESPLFRFIGHHGLTVGKNIPIDKALIRSPRPFFERTFHGHFNIDFTVFNCLRRLPSVTVIRPKSRTLSQTR